MIPKSDSNYNLRRLKLSSATTHLSFYHNFVASNRNEAFGKTQFKMKKQISKIALLALLSVGAFAQEKQAKPLQKVSITFKNNSVLPRKYTFVSYWTKDRSNNATEGMVLAPYATKTITDVVGTELFLANDKQINTVMSGKKIEDKAFWVFKSEDNGKTINLRKD